MFNSTQQMSQCRKYERGTVIIVLSCFIEWQTCNFLNANSLSQNKTKIPLRIYENESWTKKLNKVREENKKKSKRIKRTEKLETKFVFILNKRLSSTQWKKQKRFSARGSERKEQVWRKKKKKVQKKKKKKKRKSGGRKECLVISCCLLCDDSQEPPSPLPPSSSDIFFLLAW